MKLHENQDLFLEVIRAAAHSYSMRAVYIEKDYWATYCLKNVFTSALKERVVFKGGTSLSKVYGIINRFSEDVDLALLPEQGRSDSRTRKLLREITISAGKGLTEDEHTAGIEKHTKIRKVYYIYPRLADGNMFGQVGQRLLIEANAFSRPQPNEHNRVQCYLTDFLQERKESSIVADYNLDPFSVQVLLPEKTLAEKTLSLIRASLQDQPLDFLRRKIRHIYDIHQLLQMDDVRTNVLSKNFLEQLEVTLEDDLSCPTGNKDWMNKKFVDAHIFSNPKKVWPYLSSVYNADFKDMMFGPLPHEDQVLESLELLGEIVRDFDENRFKNVKRKNRKA